MKRIEMADATAPLAEFARDAKDEPVVVMVQGKPVAAVVGIGNSDWETITLSTNPRFLAIIEKSRRRQQREGGIPSREMYRRLGLKPRTRKKR